MYIPISLSLSLSLHIYIYINVYGKRGARTLFYADQKFKLTVSI